jgi:hypothetical protein
MNLQHERIATLCTKLKLERVATEWTPLAQEAARHETSYAEFLERLLKIENDARGERQRQMLLKLATLPSVKTLEQYDFGFASGAPRPQIQELASLTFIDRAENIVLLGPSGVGKTHIATALAYARPWRVSKRASSPQPTSCCNWRPHAARGGSRNTSTGPSSDRGCWWSMRSAMRILHTTGSGTSNIVYWSSPSMARVISSNMDPQ